MTNGRNSRVPLHSHWLLIVTCKWFTWLWGRSRVPPNVFPVVKKNSHAQFKTLCKDDNRNRQNEKSTFLQHVSHTVTRISDQSTYRRWTITNSYWGLLSLDDASDFSSSRILIRNQFCWLLHLVRVVRYALYSKTYCSVTCSGSLLIFVFNFILLELLTD